MIIDHACWFKSLALVLEITMAYFRNYWLDFIINNFILQDISYE